MKAVIAVLSFAFAGLSFGQVPLRWDVNLPTPATRDITIWRGETVELQPRFILSSAVFPVSTGATVSLYWSTNSFATTWTTNGSVVLTDTGRVSATWAPACDVGARQYSYFVGVSTASGLFYRVRGTITMRESPGFQPSASPIPVWDGWTNSFVYARVSQLLDLQSNSVTRSELQTTSNALVAAAGQAAGGTNAAHVSAADPHGDRAYAAGIMQTGTAAKATWADSAGNAADATARAIGSAGAYTAGLALATAQGISIDSLSGVYWDKANGHLRVNVDGLTDMQPILFYTANNGQQQYLTIYPSLFLEPLTTYWGGAGDTLLSDVLAGKALDSDMQEAKAGLSGLAETQGVLVASVSNNTAMLVAVSNATIGVWSNAVVTGDTVWLDWSISQTWRIDVTNLAFTIDCTNTPFAFAPQRMKVQLLTPTDATPSFSWPTNISWSSQVDVTSNRVYNILLEWDGWRYVGATFNSHDR